MTDYINYNPIFNKVADEQGIEPGSSEWQSGGIRPYSGTTGGHASYGWRHDYKLDEDWVRAVIANYGHRRAFYDNAPARKVGYSNGCRPKDWVIGESTAPGTDDLPGGEAIYLTSEGVVKVTGPDTLHFWIDPLYAVMDSTGYKAMALGKEHKAEYICSIIAKFLTTALSGHLMKTPTKIESYVFGDRGSSRIVDTCVQSAKRGIVGPVELEVFHNYLTQSLIPYYESAPGLKLNKYKSNGVTLPNIQVYNGLYWLIPPFYDLVNLLPDDQVDLKTRANALLVRFCQWMQDLIQLADLPNKSLNAFHVSEEFIAGDNGKPLPTLIGNVDPSEFGYSYETWNIWGFRAVDVARKVLETPQMETAWTAFKDKYLPQIGQSDNRGWLVDADRNYID